LISRKEEKLNFFIFTKPTSNQQYIFEDSHHSREHELAAFNSMFHRLLSIPIERKDYDRELKYIMETARLNGYSREMMEKNYEKNKKKKITNVTSLEPLDERKFKFISIPFYPPLTHKLDNELMKIGYKVTYHNNGKLSDCLGLLKDRIKNEGEKSGIYMIKCSS
jgi:hypothetical protein